MIFISYYTSNGRYPKLAERLRDSLKRFGLDHRIAHAQDGGDWRKSLFLKPTYIRQCLYEFRRPIVWIDADCEVRKLPSLLFTQAHDFAAFNWRACPGNPLNLPQMDGLSCAGGVLMFGYTAPAMELLDRWEAMQQSKPEIGDDPALDRVFNDARPPVNPLWLPRSYNHMSKHYGEPADDCVIYHDYCAGGHREAA